ncbi:MAG TPA: hypothetical protein VGN72_02825 [Tepidisphaeraceae bacterium]|jgi:hypothetical protein|nr:hypothetical protein [Tepidisphaeraceae bacterium]
MGIVPSKPLDRALFYQAHNGPFADHASAIGISAAEAADLAAKVTAALAAIDAQKVAQEAAEAATLDVRNAVTSMSIAGAAVIKKIRAKAEAGGGNAVYSLAKLPVPGTPAPVGKPGLVEGLKVELNPDGTLDLKWRAKNPPGCKGVIYQLYRKVESTGEFTYLGGSGQRSFTDATVPAGVPSVTYKIQGTRSTAVGKVAEFTVNFGVGSGSGARTMSVSAVNTGTPAKIAA